MKNNKLLISLMVVALSTIVLSFFSYAVEPSSQAQSMVEVIVTGRSYPSLQHYQRSLVLKAEREKALMQQLKAEQAVKREALVQDPVVHSKIDENGWKTVWFGSAQPKADQPSSFDPTETVPDQLPLSSVNEAPRVIRVLGVSPSLTELVNKFTAGENLPGPIPVPVPVSYPEELGELLQAQAEGREGPFLVLSDFGRVRLLDLSKTATDTQGDPKSPGDTSIHP